MRRVSDEELEIMLRSALLDTRMTIVALRTTVPYVAQIARVARRLYSLIKRETHVVSGNGVLARVFLIRSFDANAHVLWMYFPPGNRRTFAAIPWV